MFARRNALYVALLCAYSIFASAAPPTFQGLMNPQVFPEPQRGLEVVSAAVSGDGLKIVTTGAELLLGPTGEAVFRQRIGENRDVARIQIHGVTSTPTLTHTSTGFAFATFVSPKLDLRVNGDSLFMFHAHEPVTIEISRAIEVGFTATYKGNCLILDERGGFGLFSSDPALGDALRPYDQAVAQYTLPADAVLWIGICPPKPYDWERSLTDNVVWHWSMETGYPANEVLAAWAKEGNTVLLQSEVMLWKDWNLAFEPRLGEAEFERVRTTIHNQDMRFIVYTSPYYFLKETPLEPKAMNSFENFKTTGFPPGWPHGDNIDLFIDEITKVMANYKPDGLYFDGQYTENVPALYALARRARDVVGENGILEWHSTAALGGGLCFLPQADAYVDFILRGEGRDQKYSNLDYLRYFVSGYNTSNSIGVLCNNGPSPTGELIESLIDTNCRMHTLASWLGDPATMETVHTHYTARLTPALRDHVMQKSNERQAQIAERAKARADVLRVLHAPPSWDQPLLAASGDELMQWEPSISPLNPFPFEIQDGVLAITAKASTYAFLTHPLNASPQGFVARMKQGSDGGQSWGPAVCLRWKDGNGLRVGLRSDGLLQIDMNGSQRLFGAHVPGEWLWIRTRWMQHDLIVETSANGSDYQIVRTFNDFEGLDIAESVSIGKVPYDGSTTDFTDPGPTGACFVGQLSIY